MKRSPLTRKTPLSGGKPLTSGKPLTRKSAPQVRARSRASSKPRTPATRKDTGPSASVRDAVKLRDGGRCVRCDAPAGSIHHRSGRGMGGRKGAESERINQPSWLLSLCGSGVTGCHGWVEKHRTRAEALGYLIRRGDQDQDAEARPVRTLRGWRLFGNDCSITRTDAPEVAA